MPVDRSSGHGALGRDGGAQRLASAHACKPSWRISRSTVQRATATPSRLSCRQTLSARRPGSWLARRAEPAASTRHRALRSAFVRPGLRQRRGAGTPTGRSAVRGRSARPRTAGDADRRSLQDLMRRSSSAWAKTRWPASGSRWPCATRDLALNSARPAGLPASRRLHASSSISLLADRRAAFAARSRSYWRWFDGSPLTDAFVTVLLHHPHGALTDLQVKTLGGLPHGSIL